MANRALIISGAVSGLVFIPLLAVSVTLSDVAVPQTSLADAEFISELDRSEGTVQSLAFLWALTGIAFLGFTGAVHMGSETREHGEKLANVALLAGGLWAFTWVLGGLLLSAARSADSFTHSADLAKTALTIARNLSFSHDLLLASLFVGAASLATPPHHTGMRGLVRKIGLGAAFGLVFGSASLAIGQPFPILPLGVLLLLAWTIGTSVLLIRETPTDP